MVHGGGPRVGFPIASYRKGLFSVAVVSAQRQQGSRRRQQLCYTNSFATLIAFAQQLLEGLGVRIVVYITL